jgi:hypothetical protein
MVIGGGNASSLFAGKNYRTTVSTTVVLRMLIRPPRGMIVY